MCVVSMIMDRALEWPPVRFKEPEWVKELEVMLEKARQYDIDNDQPECEMDEKRLALKKIADEMGVEIKFL
jgi:hypothetical protein